MPTDPIIAEIHRIREQLWRQCHGSAEEMARRQRKLHQLDKNRMVDPVKWKKQRAAQRKTKISGQR